MNAPRCAAIGARQNQLLDALLDALPDAERQRWQAHLEPVELALGQVLCESGSAAQHAYFPTTAIVSLVNVTEDGSSAEIAVVGHEGVVGISIFMGGMATTSRAVVQSAGQGYRLRAQVVQNEALCGGPVLAVLLSYTLSLIGQMAQTAACNRYHSIDQLLCRRLLMSLDRAPNGDIVMTQELASSLLGVRREGVTAAAGRLQKAGVISYSRGRIAVLDRARLEQLTCEFHPGATKEPTLPLSTCSDALCASATWPVVAGPADAHTAPPIDTASGNSALLQPAPVTRRR
jgi:CRP-like cAMP-binding protein